MQFYLHAGNILFTTTCDCWHCSRARMNVTQLWTWRNFACDVVSRGTRRNKEWRNIRSRNYYISRIFRAVIIFICDKKNRSYSETRSRRNDKANSSCISSRANLGFTILGESYSRIPCATQQSNENPHCRFQSFEILRSIKSDNINRLFRLRASTNKIKRKNQRKKWNNSK